MTRWDAHPIRIGGLAFDPAGGKLVTVPLLQTTDTMPRPRPILWTPAGEKLAELPARGQSFYPMAAAFAPDGRTLAVADASTAPGGYPGLWLWNPAYGIGARCSPKSSATDLRFLPGGRLLAAVGGKVWLHPPNLTAEPTRLVGPRKVAPQAYKLAVSADGWFAAVGKMRAVVWDADAKPVAYRNHAKSPQNGPAAFRPHATVLAVGHGTVVDLWDWKAKTERTLKGHTRPVWAVGFSADGGTVYTAASDGAVLVWDAESGAQRAKFDYATGKIYSAAVSPDGLTLALGGDDGRVTVVDLDG